MRPSQEASSEGSDHERRPSLRGSGHAFVILRGVRRDLQSVELDARDLRVVLLVVGAQE